MSKSGHSEVGPWAREKLAVLARYLAFYRKVLKDQKHWRAIYIDAFAGGGRAEIRSTSNETYPGQGFLLDEWQIDADQKQLIDGSPRVALNVTHQFDRYVFIEPSPARVNELEALKIEYGDKTKIDILQMTSREGIERVVSRNIKKKTHRCIAFLDPFGAQLDWSSVESLAKTGCFEVVINFALNMAIARMLENSGTIDQSWKDRLDAYFGTQEWWSCTYIEVETMFGTQLQKRHDYLDRLLALYRRRLGEAFGYVSAPRLIRNTRGNPLYYILWAGPHKKGLEGADYVLKMGEV